MQVLRQHIFGLLYVLPLSDNCRRLLHYIVVSGKAPLKLNIKIKLLIKTPHNYDSTDPLTVYSRSFPR